MPKIGRINCHLTIGKGCVIQDDVIIGNSDKDPVIIGDNALIRSGSIIYSKVKIGNGFKTGHRALIRENSEVIMYLLGLMQYSTVIAK
jgi:carbonic anhydrase/acetyltransferase-like protein (isoleucine patch superfamily)